jgi:hypothetical protein
MKPAQSHRPCCSTLRDLIPQDKTTHSTMSDNHTVNAAEGDIDLEQYTQSVIASISSKASPRVRKAL